MSTRDAAITRAIRKIMDIGGGASGTDNTLLSDTFVGEEVDAAVSQYSTDAPLQTVIELTPGANPYIAHTSLTGFVTHWSRVLAIEVSAAAVGANYVPIWIVQPDQSAGYVPQSLDPADVLDPDYFDGTAHYLWLRAYTPAVAEKLRIAYTVPHTLTNSVDTIPTIHFDAVCDLAAAYCCTRLESKFAKSSDATIAADAVNYRDSQLRFRQAREDFLAQYRMKVGLPADGGPAPANVFKDWDSWPSWTPGDRLTHSRFRR